MIDIADGVITIDKRVAEATVIEPCPVTPDSVAVMLADPAALLVERPELEIRAMLVLDEVQRAASVMSLVDPSLYWPVAVNCWFCPIEIDGAEGLIWIDCSVTDDLLTPGPKLPLPHAQSRLRETKTIRAGYSLMTFFLVGICAISKPIECFR